MNCPQCGAPLEDNVKKCKYCGEPISGSGNNAGNAQASYQPVNFQQQPFNNAFVNNGVDPSWPLKNKTVAGLLGILLGGLGIHKFYLGKSGMGILYIIFCWTYIPAILGLIEGISYLTADDRSFQMKHHVRLQ